MKQYLNFNHSNVSNYSLQHHFGQIFKKLESGLFIILSLICIIASKTSKNFSNDVSYVFVDISMPVVKISAFPFNSLINLLTNFQELIDAKKENEALKVENTELKSLYAKSININNENQELKNILKFIVPKSANYKVAKVIGRSHGMFNQKLYLSEGSKIGINDGDIVTGAVGLLGRAIDVEEEKSRLLLPTDSSSRIPVVASKARARGILIGDNSSVMEIIYLSKNHEIKTGDMIFTSGDGESLPPGILIGVVTKVDKSRVEVEMIEDVNNADIVTVSNY